MKSEVAKFLYKDVIGIINILQDRDKRFYGEYLLKFEPMRIKEGTIFSKRDSVPTEVFFLHKGTVFAGNDKMTFGTEYQEGTMFGETDIIFERNRAQNFIAKDDCYILKLDKQVFKDILLEFPDFY